MVQIVPTCNPNGKATIFDAPGQKPVKTKKSKIPRPPNAFILYRNWHHPLIKAANPEMHNNQICKFTFLFLKMMLIYNSCYHGCSVEG